MVTNDSELWNQYRPWAQPYEIASLTQRFFAYLFDSLAVFALYLIAFIVVHAVAPIVQQGYGPSWKVLFAGNLDWILFVVVDGMYHVFFWTCPRGQTPGKRYVNNRFIKLDGGRLTLRDALIRYAMSWLMGLLLGIGWLRMIGHPTHRGWHDRAAGTIVVLNEPAHTADTAPFRPRSLVWGWMPFGIPVVAMMAAVNWQRLGHPERFLPTLVGGLAVSLALVIGINHPLFYQFLPPTWQGQVAGLIGIAVGIALLYGFLVSRAQLVDYQAWRERNGGQHPTAHQSGHRTFGRMVLASFAVNAVFTYLLAPLVVNLTAPLLPDREFTDGIVSMTYPGRWWTTTVFDNVQFCQQSGVICLIAGSDRMDDSAELNFELERFGGLGVLLLSAEDADDQMWAAILAQNPAAQTNNQEVRQLDGHTVVERQYRVGGTSAVWVYIKDGTNIYRFYAEAAAVVFDRERTTLRRMIDSIRLMPRL